MAASLTPSGRPIIQQVRHYPSRSGAELHINPGGRMVGGPGPELELQGGSIIPSCCSKKDVGHTQDQEYPGTDNKEDGPFGEGYPHGCGRGPGGRRGRLVGQGDQERRGR